MIVIGLDEVGRGCWAGPLLAAAVVLPVGHTIDGLDDSKVLSARKRQLLDSHIRSQATAIGVGWVWPIDIDKNGITWSVKTAMYQAYWQVTTQLHASTVDNDTAAELPDCDVIIDGSYNFLPEVAGAHSVIKADGSIPAVSAASIIAKVARDHYMATVAATVYPAYGFERHVGYGTAAHIAALQQYGVTPIHRKSYKPIKAML